MSTLASSGNQQGTHLTTIYTATGRRPLSLDPCLDDIRGTAHTRGNPDGDGRTIPGTCPALHATVEIFDFSLFPFHLKDSVGTDTFTHATPHTSFGVELQRRYAG